MILLTIPLLQIMCVRLEWEAEKANGYPSRAAITQMQPVSSHRCLILQTDLQSLDYAPPKRRLMRLSGTPMLTMWGAQIFL